MALEEPDDPVRTRYSEVYSSGNKYVELRISDKKKDLGQNIVPYFDLQEVTMNPPMPLQGIGIFHKGRNGFGGFIAPKIFHYDLMKEKDVSIEETKENNVEEGDENEDEN